MNNANSTGFEDKNGGSPAQPVMGHKDKSGEHLYGQLFHGLTKRETMAMHLTAALLTATNSDGEWTGVNASAGKQGLKEADALLKELSK